MDKVNMIPKIASALARALDPIRSIERPGKSITSRKSAGAEDGGHGSAGYDQQEKAAQDQSPKASSESSEAEGPPAKVFAEVPFRPGFTQVIVDLTSHRPERSGGAAVQSYETGAKDQKKNARIPKGSMLDKKVG